MKNKISFTLGAVALFIGVVLGYSIAMARTHTMTMETNHNGMHMMPDGSMMNNDGTQVHDNEHMMDMSEMMDHMNNELKEKTGNAFDEAFLSEMIVHHQGAVDMSQIVLTNAQHSELKTFAQQIIQTQNKEIADMKQWLKEWYNK